MFQVALSSFLHCERWERATSRLRMFAEAELRKLCESGRGQLDGVAGECLRAGVGPLIRRDPGETVVPVRLTGRHKR